MNERRQLERFGFKVPAAVEYIAPLLGNGLLKLLTTNVCSGGASYLHTAEPFLEGTEARVELVLPLNKLKKLKNEHKRAYVRITGRVLRSESRGMAIGFDGDYQIAGSINEGQRSNIVRHRAGLSCRFASFRGMEISAFPKDIIHELQVPHR